MQGQQRNAWICTRSKKQAMADVVLTSPGLTSLKSSGCNMPTLPMTLTRIVGRSLLNLRLYLSVLPSDKSYHQIVGKKAEQFSAKNRRAGLMGERVN